MFFNYIPFLIPKRKSAQETHCSLRNETKLSFARRLETEISINHLEGQLSVTGATAFACERGHKALDEKYVKLRFE